MLRSFFNLLMILMLGFFSTSGCSSDNGTVIIWDISEQLRIGSQMGGGPDMFGEIGALTVGPNDLVYVYDSSAHEIRVFNRSGYFVNKFGGPGAGPGEFASVWSMIWGPEDNLWIVDIGNQRYSIFDSTGVLIDDMRSSITSRDASVAGFDRSGNFYDQSAYIDSDNIYRRELIRITRNGEQTGKVLLPDFTRQALQLGSMRLPLPFSREQVFCFDPEGYIWYGNNDRYEIFRMDLDGERIPIITGSTVNLPLSSTERDSVNAYVDRLKSQFRMASVPGDIVPKVKPVFDGIFLDQKNGDVWIKLINYEGMATVFDVFERNGSIKGKVRCETQIFTDPAPVILGEEIWFITEDEIGAQYVVRGVLVK